MNQPSLKSTDPVWFLRKAQLRSCHSGQSCTHVSVVNVYSSEAGQVCPDLTSEVPVWLDGAMELLVDRPAAPNYRLPLHLDGTTVIHQH